MIEEPMGQNELTDDEKKELEAIKDMCRSPGMSLFLGDLVKHKNSSDTTKVMPIFDQNMKIMLSSQSDELLKRLGYVSALEWVIGLIEHYKD